MDSPTQSVSLRICLLSKQFHPSGGGSERYAHVIANALARRGHSVDVFAMGDGDESGDLILHTKMNVTLLERRRRALMTFETTHFSVLARRAIGFTEYHIIHGTLMPASPIALTIAPPDTPLVVTSHGTSIGEVRSHKLELPSDYLKKFLFHPANVLMDAVTAPRADRTIAISTIARRELQQYYPVDHDRITKIPHGVDTARFTPDVSDHPAVTPDKFTLFHVGRLVSRRHVDLVIQGVAAIDRNDIELLVAGTGRHRDRLEARTRELGVAN